MSNRKQTPDVLGEVLSGPPAPPLRSSAQPAPARAPTARARGWEYMQVIFRDYGGYRPRAVNGQELPEWKSQPLLLDYLNQVGAQGWELVTLNDRRAFEREAYFKRVRP